VRIPS